MWIITIWSEPRSARTLHESTRFRSGIIGSRWRTPKCRDYQWRRSSQSCDTRRLIMSPLLGNAMVPKPKVEILPSALRRRDPAAFDAFHEDRVREDLAEFAEASGLVEQ